MSEFAQYLNNLSWWSILDLVVIITLTSLVLAVFINKNSIRLALIYALYFIAFIAVSVIYAYSDSGILYITKRIFDYLNIFMIMVFVVVYQNDFKLLFVRLGRPADWLKQSKLNSDDELILATSEISKAILNMSKNNVGAIIVIFPSILPQSIIETGTVLNAKLSYGLIESIFNTSSPLHDGAVVIKGDTLIAAGCFLPLSENVNISKELGTRHRAAIGLTEQTDVLAIVVSEETGIISTVRSNEFNRYVTVEKLTEQIQQTYGINFNIGRR